VEADVSNGSVVAVVAAVIGVVLLGAVALGGLGGTRVETSVSEPVPWHFDGPPADGSYGIVMGSHQSKSGLELFGLTIGRSRWEANIALVPPEGCEVSDGNLPPGGPCETAAATGRVNGGGTTASGLEFVIVSTEVSEGCHEALQPYERWPTNKPACNE
jgi:hypothetical protein